MLQNMRKYTQGWIATAMGIFLSLIFVFWGVENYFIGRANKNRVASVNGKDITSAELGIYIQRMLIQLEEQAGSAFSLSPFMQESLKVQALTTIIVESVLEQAATQAGFRVTVQESKEVVKQMPSFQEDGSFSKNRFEQVISKLGYSQQAFLAAVSKRLLLNQVSAGIINSDFVLPNELDQAMALLDQKRDIEYLLFPAGAFKKRVHVSPEQITQYYNTHQRQFSVPMKLQIQYVQLSVDALKKNLSVTSQEMAQYVATHPEIEGKDPRLIAQIKATLLQQKAEQAFLVASEQLSDGVFTTPHSLDEIAKKLGLNVNTSEYFSHAGGKHPLTQQPKILAAAFNAELLKDRTNSNLIELAPGNVVVIRIKDVQPKAIAPLFSVQDKIKATLVDLHAAQMAKARAMALVAQVQNKGDFSKLAAAQHLTVMTKSTLSRSEKTINPALLHAAFSIAPASKRPLTTVQLANGDCMVMRLKASINFDTNKATDAQRAKMYKLYSTAYGKESYYLYVGNQMRKASIKYPQIKAAH